MLTDLKQSYLTDLDAAMKRARASADYERHREAADTEYEGCKESIDEMFDAIEGNDMQSYEDHLGMLKHHAENLAALF